MERGRNSRIGNQAHWKPHNTGAESGSETEAVREAPASFGPLMGARCGFDYVGVAVPSSQVWTTLTFSAGVVAEVWLWSDEKEAKTCAYNEGPVWLETRERGTVVQEGQCKGLSLGSTHIAAGQHGQLELQIVLFGRLFHACHLAGQKWYHLTRSIIIIFDSRGCLILCPR